MACESAISRRSKTGAGCADRFNQLCDVKRGIRCGGEELRRCWRLASDWAICATWSAGAGAATLTGSLTADDAFVVYISKSSSQPGRLIAQGNNWATTYSLPSISLTPGTYYLNIEVTNYGGPGGLIGDFTVGGRHLLTDTTDWFASRNSGSIPRTWVSRHRQSDQSGLERCCAMGKTPWHQLKRPVDRRLSWALLLRCLRRQIFGEDNGARRACRCPPLHRSSPPASAALGLPGWSRCRVRGLNSRPTVYKI